jgi:hypothetical protein
MNEVLRAQHLLRFLRLSMALNCSLPSHYSAV